MIDKIRLENFTVFKNIEIEFCTGINVIIGENGSGKTHLLKAIYANKIDSDKPWQFFGSGNEINLMSNNKYTNMKTSINLYGIDKNNTHIQYVFIPAKEMLSHSKGLLVMSEKYSKDMPFDRTLLDILKKAQVWKPDIIPELARNIAPRLENILDGIVVMKDDNSFWVRKHDGMDIPFSMEAEGLRKFGLLWQLLMNESISKDTILLWDEPEANLNPQLFSVLADILLELSRHGVQMFIATHSYDLTKFIDVKKQNKDLVLFHSLYRTSNGVKCETANGYQKLKNNAIENGAVELYNTIIEQSIEEISNE